ncbi:MAG: carboxypeptidase regulatory-like domain-containing protein, partial [Candidatus Lutacidiplasmatales archaeon]
NLNLGGFVTGGAGYYVAFLPNGASNFQTSGAAGALVPATSSTASRVLQAGAVVPGPNVSMAEFGFVTATIRTVGTHVPLSEIHFVAAGGPTNQPLSGSAISNGLGFVNVSAPPGNDSVTAGSTAYTNVTGFTTVTSGATDPYGPISMTALAGDGLADVRSVFVNIVGVPPTPGAVDNITESPVLGLHVVEDIAGGVHGAAALGSDLGQYFLSAVPADAANITFSALGFTSLTLHENLTAGLNLVEPELNMTANGILEGRVVADPGNISVPYADVVVCPTTQSTCLNHIQTNVSGEFWIGAPAGLDEVTVDSPLYLSNLTKLVNVGPDTFTDLGDVPVFTFGTVHGFVRSLPYGDLLADVNVSVCSKYSAPGSCLPDETVATDANGTFSIQSPPGTYYLYASTPGYNATRYLIEISPGADLFVGTMFLQQYGQVLGEVVNVTGVPVGGATVFPCPTYSGPCGAAATTASDGSYHLWTSPGPTVLTASAPGYVDGALPVTVVSGGVVHAATIVLTPIPPNVEENVSGTVTAAATGSGLANALVVADENGGRVGQTVTGAGGAYRLQVRWGTVEVVVGAPNYRSENATLTVHANVTGVDFALAAMTYRVWGVTSDEGTRTILSGVQIANNGTTVARSDSNGLYQLQLPNGTTTLTASYATNGTIQYGTVHYAVPVSGASVEYNLALPRSVVPLRGVVVNAATGRPLTAASVTLWTPEGKGAGSRATDRDGQFTFGAGPGTYNVSVAAPGFEPTNQTVSTGEAGNYTTVSLEPISTGKGPAGIPTIELAALVGGAVAVGAAAVVAIRSGRSRSPPADPEDDLLPVYEPPT